MIRRLSNVTGHDIKEIHISPSGQKEWGPSVLKAAPEDGQTLELTSSEKATSEKWDIKAIYTDVETAE